MKKLKLFVFIVISFHFGIVSAFAQEKLPHKLEIETIYGSVTVTDPLVIELVQSPAFQRLKGIRHYGSTDYVFPHAREYSRYEHSLGVYFLLKKYGASRQEQVAGLLHDVSHTVFSHSTDPLFMGGFTNGAYQDTIHKEFMEKYGIAKILQKYGMCADKLCVLTTSLPALKQKLPAMCADRIEYNLFAGYIDHNMTPEDVRKITRHLHYEKERWYFDDASVARKFAEISLFQTTGVWASPQTIYIGNWTSVALKRAWDLKLITLEDIQFKLADDDMWKLLCESEDPVIKKAVNNIKNARKAYVLQPTSTNTDKIFIGKFRGVDPLVKTAGGFKRLSELDPEFKAKFDDAEKIAKAGWPAKWTEIHRKVTY